MTKLGLTTNKIATQEKNVLYIFTKYFSYI